MKKAMFIVAAPVGAVPKRLYAFDPKFLADQTILSIENRPNMKGFRLRLIKHGWEEAEQGGVGIQFPSGPTGTEISRNFFALLPDPTSRSLVSLLSTQGWQSDGAGGMYWIWGREGGSSYLPRRLVLEMEAVPAALDMLKDAGWEVQPAGCWLPGKGYSPYLPITPQEIIQEALACFGAGAAVVHLHTRDASDEEIVRFRDGAVAARLCRQDNLIDENQYDQIVPAVISKFPEAILNISTSVRGKGSDFDSPLRRAPLKRYEPTRRVPEIASFSPGAVRFKAGGGYENRDDFLREQVNHFEALGVRPEVEVFNKTILNNAVGAYAQTLRSCGEPVLFMLVAGVDQVGGDEVQGLHDDSLIKPAVRDHAAKCLASGDAQGTNWAKVLLVDELRPVVSAIRQTHPESLISLLLPGPLQALVADIAIALDLDGVRVGLEDALTVPDATLPGGVRKSIGSQEQVRRTYRLLQDRGVRVMNAKQLRALLDPSELPTKQMLVAHL